MVLFNRAARERLADRILIVEDDSATAEILARSLEREGYEIRICSDGSAAGSLVRQFRPDLVLLDMMLPGQDGAEICRGIRRDHELRSTRVIGMSSSGERQVVRGMRGSGADDFIEKPFSAEELLQRIRTQIGLPRLNPDLLENNRVLIVGEMDTRVLQCAGYRVRAGTTIEEATHLIADFQPDVILAVDTEAVREALPNHPVAAVEADALGAVVGAIGPVRSRRSKWKVALLEMLGLGVRGRLRGS